MLCNYFKNNYLSIYIIIENYCGGSISPQTTSNFSFNHMSKRLKDAFMMLHHLAATSFKMGDTSTHI